MIFRETTTTMTRTTRSARGGPKKEEEPIFEKIEGIEPPPEIRQGFWQFDEKLAWQTVLF